MSAHNDNKSKAVLSHNKPNKERKIIKTGVKSKHVNHARIARQHLADTTALRKLIAQKTDVKGGWFDVKDNRDALAVEVDTLRRQLEMYKGAARAAIGASKIRAKLYFVYSQTSAANAGNSLVAAVQPTNSAEYAQYAVLYDEVKVNAVKVHYGVGSAVGTTGTPTGVFFSAIGYDSTYSSSPSSVTDVLESTQSQLHGFGSQGVGTMPSIVPAEAKVFHAKIPNSTVLNGNAAGTTVPNFPGSWMAVGDTQDTCGYIRFYAEAIGATGQTGIRLMFEYDCEFRERT